MMMIYEGPSELGKNDTLSVLAKRCHLANNNKKANNGKKVEFVHFRELIRNIRDSLKLRPLKLFMIKFQKLMKTIF